MRKFLLGLTGLLAIVFTYQHFATGPVLAKKPIPSTAKKAYFAGGCFWCTEADFEKRAGVYEAISGYAGGPEKNPTYRQVASGETGHVEAVEVYYDPAKVSYDQLLTYFWRHVNPTDSGGQFVDRGAHYRPVIFYTNEAEKFAAEKSRAALGKSGKFSRPIKTDILKFTGFYPAEDYHQDYYKKNPWRYNRYRKGSGRDDFLQKTWKSSDLGNSDQRPVRLAQNMKAQRMTDAGAAGKQPYSKPSDDVLRRKLTPMQYNVTQKDGTEPAFRNEYHDNKAAGIYVDIVSGEPLFSSLDKFDSRTGWPSFVKPLEPANISTRTDYKIFYPRTEVRSKFANSHLGHVFKDGPKDRGGLRYCINSASLRFVPAKDLEKQGYGQYAKLFSGAAKNAQNTGGQTIGEK